ncbi:peptide-methionine (R)-S-oxide reductase MsrB [Marivita sp. S0852]|uniref:peptide-methionine (R)-S-oxide reductase MsrB n=1 Tax=Marivita sp. S0852 TaxID=3373893 RepID=UPI003982BC65
MIRRHFLKAAAALGLTASAKGATASQGTFEVTRTDAEWNAMLTPAEYRVMREHGTERAFTSPLNSENRAGMFHCRGCDLALYASEHKYDSGTGWPSFWQAQADAIGTRPDRSLFMVRTECHCRRCGSHLGHIFDDGPQPTGKRHCINGVSLRFRAA